MCVKLTKPKKQAAHEYISRIRLPTLSTNRGVTQLAAVWVAPITIVAIFGGIVDPASENIVVENMDTATTPLSCCSIPKVRVMNSARLLLLILTRSFHPDLALGGVLCFAERTLVMSLACFLPNAKRDWRASLSWPVMKIGFFKF